MARPLPNRERTGPPDCVRRIAVLFVVLGHESARDRVLAQWLQIHGMGYTGVYLSIVQSGQVAVRKLRSEDEVRAAIRYRIGCDACDRTVEPAL